MDSEDKDLIKQLFLNEHDIVLTRDIGNIVYTQKYKFRNSRHITAGDKFTWVHSFYGRKKKAKKERALTNDEALLASTLIKTRIPSILYFPNFLFDFPEKIDLTADPNEDETNTFYKRIIQDILDKLGNNMDVETHIVERALSDDENDKKHLKAVLGKMGRQVTATIFAAWEKMFDRPPSNDKEIQIDYDVQGTSVLLQFSLKDSDDIYLINQRSLGFRWFFVFLLLTQFRGYRKGHKNVLFLFDEPASNLHSTAQNQLLKSFTKLENVIYTTHSHHLINPDWLESTFVVRNTALTYDDADEGFKAKNTNIEIEPYRKFAAAHPTLTNYYQPILDVLDYKFSELELRPDVIIVEGKSDYYFLNYFQRVLKRKRIKLNFMPAVGASGLANLISLNLGWGQTFAVLLDSDEEGSKQRDKYVEDFGDIMKDRVITYSDIESDWGNYEIETLIPVDDRMAIQRHCFPDSTGFDKKQFARAIQELLLTKSKVPVSQTLIERFDTVHDHLVQALKTISYS